MRAPRTPREAMQQCAHELLLRSTEIAARITHGVVERLPELVADGSPETRDAVRESTDQNVGAIFSTLAFELVWQEWSGYVSTQVTDAETLHQVLAMSSQHIFTFIDRCCQQLVVEHRAEFGGTRPAAAAERAPGDVVRVLLGDGVVDEAAAGRELGLDVDGHHVCLVLSPVAPDSDVGAVLDAVQRAAGREPVAVPAGDGTWWAWFSWPGPPEGATLERMAAVRMPGVLAGMGGTGRGRAGFRSTHAQACEADTATRLGARPGAGVVRHRDVELAAVLCVDVDRARRLASARLGALGSPDETAERLRQTLLTYLSQGCSKTRTAAALHVHLKTVSYRLAQAEALLGRSPQDDVLELGAALLIDRTLRGGSSAS